MKAELVVIDKFSPLWFIGKKDLFFFGYWVWQSFLIDFVGLEKFSNEFQQTIWDIKHITSTSRWNSPFSPGHPLRIIWIFSHFSQLLQNIDWPISVNSPFVRSPKNQKPIYSIICPRKSAIFSLIFHPIIPRFPTTICNNSLSKLFGTIKSIKSNYTHILIRITRYH